MLREITLGRLLDEAADHHPDNDAVVYVDRNFRLTYRDFREVVDQLARGLMHLGVQKGEEVGAFIIVKPGWTLTAEEVRNFCRGRIARYKIPKYIAFVDSYPMTASGKIQKYKLRETAGKLFPKAMR